MMTKRYLIKLYPTGPFFFGGETTFGAGLRRNYLARSEDLPQQTTLLGLLRYQLLAQNKQIPIADKQVAENLIGPASFRVEDGTNFGLINALSPVFLMKGETAYRLNPVDDAIFLKADETDPKKKILHRKPLTPIAASIPGKAYVSGRLLNEIPNLIDFNHKTHYQKRFTNAIDNHTFEKDKVLCPIEHIGIQKSRDGQTLTNAFFKQTLLQFPTLDWSFAFYADLGTEYEHNQKNKRLLNLAGALVTLGGEQALFKMVIKAMSDEPKDKPIAAYKELFGLESAGSSERIELLSDAYVTDDLYEHCRLAYTDTISFRAIKTTVQNTRHYHNHPQKTERLELLKRGSVLWSTDPEKTTAVLENALFQTIGYNAFYNGPLTSTASTQPDE